MDSSMITKITCEYIDDDNKNKKTLTKDLATDAMTIFHSDYNYYRFTDMYNKTNPENFTDIKKNIISATRNKLIKLYYN